MRPFPAISRAIQAYFSALQTVWRRERDSNLRYRFWNAVKGHTCATCKGFCNNNIHPENWLKVAEGKDWSGFMTRRKANGQRLSGRRKCESMAYFPTLEMVSRDCQRAEQSDIYSPPNRTKNRTSHCYQFMCLVVHRRLPLLFHFAEFAQKKGCRDVASCNVYIMEFVSQWLKQHGAAEAAR